MAGTKKFDIRASLKEMYVRYIGVSSITKNSKIYWNGHNNLYPSECDAVIGNSSTASQGAKVFSRFLKGAGLTDEKQDVIVNLEKNYKLSNLIGLTANSVSKQGGAFIFVGRDALLEPQNLDVLNYEFCRKAKEDDAGFDGKIVYKDWTETDDRFSRKQKEDKWYYPFSNNKEIILAQIKNDYKLKKGDPSDASIADMLPYYRGQVLYLNTTPEYVYAKSPIDAAYNDADTEYRISLYVNGEFRSGFLGKTLVVTQGLDEKEVEQKQEEIREWLGAENAKNIYTMDVPIGVDIDQFFKITQVKAQFDEKMFAETKKDLKKNILGQFESLPEILVLVSDGAMFGASEGALIEAKKFYNQQTFDLRWQIAETMKRIGFECEIKEISTDATTTTNNI